MSLNNQIFSLREAIIKAKRKAKHETSSEDSSESQQQQFVYNNQSVTKIFMPINSIIESQKRSYQKYDSNQKSFDEQKINTIAKNLYSSRKKRLSVLQKQSPYKNNQLLPQSMKDSIDRSPLTYSKTFAPMNGQDSRVSNFTVNSQISSKSRIKEKLEKLKKIVPDKLSNSVKLKKAGQESCYENRSTLEMMNECSLFEETNQNNQKQFQDNYPDYLVSQKELQIPSLLAKINEIQSNFYKKGEMNKKQKINKIHDIIRQWKNIKTFQNRSELSIISGY